MASGVDLASPFVQRARLQKPDDGWVRCLACERACRLKDGATGWCRTRVNRGGVLYSLIYGAVSSLSANPIEKKPFYHFYPGSRALTVGSWSCNFGCPWCQNWHISKAEPPERGEFLSPAQFVRRALSSRCQGTSISFNEPTLSLEWSLEAFPLAHAQGLYNTFVTNGYMTERALDLLAEAGLDALSVDLKGDPPALRRWGQGVEVEKVWSRCRQAREMGLHLEITTLVIPGVNDAPAVLGRMAERMATDLGAEVPWHLSGYSPAFQFEAPPTPVVTLERAWEIGRRAGLLHVYLGNVPGHPKESTFCPGCGARLVERCGFEVALSGMDADRCSRCGRPVAGVGWDWAGAGRRG